MIHKLFFVIGLIFLIMAALHHHRFSCHMKCGAHSRQLIQWKLRSLSRKLKLNSDQKIKLRQFSEEMRVLHEDVEPEHRQTARMLLVEIQKDTLDQARITGLIDAHLQKVRDRIPTAVEKLAEFQAVLTTEQKRKIADMAAKSHKR